MIKNSISAFVLSSFLIFSLNSNISYAAEELAVLDEGEVAPFAGTLFSVEAAAKLVVSLESAQELCTLRCDEAKAVEAAALQLELSLMTISRDSIKWEYEQVLEIKNNQIDFLQEQVQKPRFPYETVFIVGLVSGVGLTLAAAYSLNQVAGN